MFHDTHARDRTCIYTLEAQGLSGLFLTTTGAESYDSNVWFAEHRVPRQVAQVAVCPPRFVQRGAQRNEAIDLVALRNERPDEAHCERVEKEA